MQLLSANLRKIGDDHGPVLSLYAIAACTVRGDLISFLGHLRVVEYLPEVRFFRSKHQPVHFNRNRACIAKENAALPYLENPVTQWEWALWDQKGHQHRYTLRIVV